jgi:hypothetical protein
LLQTIGAADPSGRVPFVLERPDGSTLELTVAPGSPLKWKMVGAFDARNTPVSVMRRHPEQRYYWFEYLPDARAMYVQYNSCQNDPARPFADFAREVFAAADHERVDRWIVDLRKNSGGMSGVIGPLTNRLASRKAHEPVFVLIGGGTFSAAIENAMDLKAKVHATLVGEPTGGKPNIFGNPKTVTLPNSKLSVQFSTSFVRHVSNDDQSAVEPDVRVSATLADVLAGRDPVLDAARKPSTSATDSTMIGHPFRGGDADMMFSRASVVVALVAVMSIPVVARVAVTPRVVRQSQTSSPGPEQARLLAMAGTWQIEMTLWPRPGGPGLSTTGTSTIRPILNGRFIEEKIEGSLGGAAFTTLAWTGFNTWTHHYEATRISTSNTARIAETGDYDATKQQFELSAAYDMAGDTWHQRTVIRQTAADAMVATSYMSFGQVPEWKGAEIKYTRKADR